MSLSSLISLDPRHSSALSFPFTAVTYIGSTQTKITHINLSFCLQCFNFKLLTAIENGIQMVKNPSATISESFVPKLW